MLAHLLGQLDARESASTFVLPNRQHAEGVKSVEQHISRGRDLGQIQGEIWTTTTKKFLGPCASQAYLQNEVASRGKLKPVRFKHATGFKLLSQHELEAAAA